MTRPFTEVDRHRFRMFVDKLRESQVFNSTFPDTVDALFGRLDAAEKAIGQHNFACFKADEGHDKCICGLDERVGNWQTSKGE